MYEYSMVFKRLEIIMVIIIIIIIIKNYAKLKQKIEGGTQTPSVE